MMDKIKQEGSIPIPESLRKRNELRLEKIAKKKEEIDDEGPNQLDVFTEAFKIKKQEIEVALELAPNIRDRNKLSEHFHQISRDIQHLNKYTFASSVFLRPYDLRMCKDIIQNFQDSAQELEDKLLPKRKFGFKHKVLVQPKSESTNKLNKKNNVQKTFIVENGCGFQDRSSECLILPKNQIYKRDVVLSRLKGCTVILEGLPNTIQINSISDCTIISGPVTTSVMVEDCKDSKLVIACQQLRIHSTVRTDLYLHVTTKAIIEDSQCIRLAPYNYSYDGLQDDFLNSGLDPNKNNWDQIDDFNWLANKPSPHWSILPEEERVFKWPCY